MRNRIWNEIWILTLASCFLSGCGHTDTDVTQSPENNFSSFAGTVWKTKAKVAIAEIKRYTGERQLALIAPRRFDPTLPDYVPLNGANIIAELPAETVIRIERFMRDEGVGKDNQVKARLENGTYAQKIVNLDRWLLAKNRFLEPGDSSSTNWNVNPDIFEKAEGP